MTTSTFFNDPDDTVGEMLETLARTRPVRLAAQGSSVDAVVREELDGSRVAVVSGGGSGHEPAHAGFVGDGMLTAAVCGGFFASPSVESVLAVLRAATGDAGCVLVVKNYTGDRLNFGLAAERAGAEGLDVEVVTVAEDVALDNDEPRGLAGTLLVHKVAGHHAREGASLADVAAAAREVSSACATMSLSLSSALLPGSDDDRRDAELGLGIHNEPGVEQVSPSSAADAVGLVMEPLLAAVDERHGADAPLVVLVNDLGGCSVQELMVLTREVLDRLGDRARVLVGPAPMMTSVDMHGFSVTLAPHSDALEEALRSPADGVDWPGAHLVRTPVTFDPPVPEGPDMGSGERDEAVEAGLRAATAALRDAREELDELDAKAGDGDAGATMADGADAIDEALDDDRLSTGSPAVLAEELAHLVATHMGGSSGVLASILLTGLRHALADGEGVDAGLRAGMDAVTEHGGAEVGDRTFLDALAPAVDAWSDGLRAAADAAREGADRTASMTETSAGRAGYVPDEELDGVKDPGAEAVARILDAWADAST